MPRKDLVARARRQVTTGIVVPRRNPGQYERVRRMYRDGIIEGMARRLWVFAWMNYVTDQGPPCPDCGNEYDRLDMGGGIWECQGCLRSFEFPDRGLEWFEQAPLTPKAARQAAGDLADLIKKTDGDDILMLFEGAMLFDQGEDFQWEVDEHKQGGKTVLKIPDANARLAFDFGSALASDSLLPSDDFGAWSRDHVVERSGRTFRPQLPSFRVGLVDDILNWFGEDRWLGAESGTLIDEATGQAPEGRVMRAELRDYGDDPTAIVRAGEWRLHIDRSRFRDPGSDLMRQRWFRGEGRLGDREVAPMVIPLNLREAMIRLGMQIWNARVPGRKG